MRGKVILQAGEGGHINIRLYKAALVENNLVVPRMKRLLIEGKNGGIAIIMAPGGGARMENPRTMPILKP